MRSSQGKFEGLVAGVLSYNIGFLHYEHHDILKNTTWELLIYTILRETEETREVCNRRGAAESLVKDDNGDLDNEHFHDYALEAAEAGGGLSDGARTCQTTRSGSASSV